MKKRKRLFSKMNESTETLNFLDSLKEEVEELSVQIDELKRKNVDLVQNVINIEYCNTLDILPRIDMQNTKFRSKFYEKNVYRV